MSSVSSISRIVCAPTIRPPHKVAFSTNDLYGERRLRLGAVVARLLEREGVRNWSLDSGTLLGAWRTGRQIPTDDDIDFLIYLPEYRVQVLEELRGRLAPHLPEPYRSRVVSTYCEKIEFFDPTDGEYRLHGSIYRGARFHHVTCDLQVYADRKDDPSIVQMLHDASRHLGIPRSLMVFEGSIVLDDESFRCVSEVEAFLTCLYGYLGADGVYNPTTKLYNKVVSRMRLSAGGSPSSPV